MVGELVCVSGIGVNPAGIIGKYFMGYGTVYNVTSTEVQLVSGAITWLGPNPGATANLQPAAICHGACPPAVILFSSIPPGTSSATLCHGACPPMGMQGYQGFQGNQGFQGERGFQGDYGPQGFQGNQGFQGIDGLQGFQGGIGLQGFQGSQGFQGATGLQGYQGFQGPAGDKLAIVDTSKGYRALACIEAPETLFFDIVGVVHKGTTCEFKIDDMFVEVCEYGTIKVISVVSSEPIAIGAEMKNYNSFITRTMVGCQTRLNVLLSGVRKGFAGKRFAVMTKEQFVRNQEFWQSM
jgi:hypothetical protein